MRLLLDTNIFLEIILDQVRAEEARALLLKCGSHDLYATDFSIHSVGVLLFRKNQHQAYASFLHDVTVNAGVKVLSLGANDMDHVIAAARKFNSISTMPINTASPSYTTSPS